MFFKQTYFIPYTVEGDYVQEVSDAPERIYAQYRNKPKAVAWYNITRQLAQEIGSAAYAVRTMYDIDLSSGEQLNIIGRIVGVSREFISNIPLSPALFALTNGDEFGDMSAMFSATNVNTDNQMSDDFYRIVIKAKIIKNNSDASTESILFGMNFMLPNAGNVRVVDHQDMSFSIEFYGNITNLERWILLNASLIPKPQGVKFNGFLEGRNYVQFGDSFSEFGDDSAEFVGYVGGD